MYLVFNSFLTLCILTLNDKEFTFYKHLVIKLRFSILILTIQFL